jgi:membrane protease YdiL (CAAX protease family)
MKVAAAVLATVLAVALVLLQPWLGRRRYRRLVDAVAGRFDRPDARLHHYRRGMINEWLAVGVVAIIGWLADRTPSSIGLQRGPHYSDAVTQTAEVAAVLAISALLFRLGRPGVRQILRRQVRSFEALLPRTTKEKATFALLAVTAGVCEEILFRGFGIAYLRWLWPAAPRNTVIALTAAAFGFAHLYQGARGVLLTGIIGAYLAWVTITTGSLLPAMVMHALLDLRILALPDLYEPAGRATSAPGEPDS